MYEFFSSGVRMDTGEYLLSPITAADLADRAARPLMPASEAAERRRAVRAKEPRFAVRDDINAANLAEAGWAAVFPANGDPAVVDALQVLLDRRRDQAGKRYRAFAGTGGDPGYRYGEGRTRFLLDRGAAPKGRVDPARFPYYVLLVGPPDEIPYTFQYELDVQYAVGRLDLGDAAAYRAYAKAIVEYEEQAPRAARFAAFGPEHPTDAFTAASAVDLVDALARHVAGRLDDAEHVVPSDATQQRLLDLLGGGPDKPDLVFTAGHGLGLPIDHPRQRAYQGALVCQEWPGPGHAVERAHIVAAHDLPNDADASGLIAFIVACYGAGTPATDSFETPPTPLASVPFTSELPRALLGHPCGAAIAVVGHVDRAWSASFRWPGAPTADIGTYEEVVMRILRGLPVGLAVEPINEEAGELTVTHDQLRAEDEDGHAVDVELARVFVAMHDARNLVVLGDPAARLRAAGAD